MNCFNSKNLGDRNQTHFPDKAHLAKILLFNFKRYFECILIDKKIFK